MDWIHFFAADDSGANVLKFKSNRFGLHHPRGPRPPLWELPDWNALGNIMFMLWFPGLVKNKVKLHVCLTNEVLSSLYLLFFFQLCTNWKKQNWEKPTWTWGGTTNVAVAQWCRTPLSTATISEVQFPRHIRETLQGQTCRCENQRTWGAGTPRTAPIPQQGRVEVAPGARTDSAPLDQPRRVEEGGGETGGSANQYRALSLLHRDDQRSRSLRGRVGGKGGDRRLLMMRSKQIQ